MNQGAWEVLTVGETMAMVAPEDTGSVREATGFQISAGGAESNVAAQLASLGRRVRWFSRLGDDPLGRRITDQLSAAGVEVSTVITDPDHPTGLYVKDRRHGVFYYRSTSAAAHLSVADAEAVDLSGVSVLHVSGITAAISSGAAEFLSALLSRARAEQVLISFDVNHRPPLWEPGRAAPVLADLCERADLVFVGRDEAERLWGTATARDVRQLLGGVSELVVKDAEHGAWTFLGDQEVFVASETVEVVDAVGAGDAFAGGYLDALLAGEAPAERLLAGHRCAARVLRSGADMIIDAPGHRRSGSR